MEILVLERGRQAGEEVPGRYKAFGRAVRQALGWDGGTLFTSRMAMRKTGISHTTITTMAQGDRPRMEIVIDFAQGMGIDPNELLRAAEYPEIITPDIAARLQEKAPPAPPAVSATERRDGIPALDVRERQAPKPAVSEGGPRAPR